MFTPYLPFRTLTSGHADSINCLSFCIQGDHLASGGDDSALIIWHVSTGTIVNRFELDSPVLSIVWDPRWNFTVICGCQSGTAVVIHDFQSKDSARAVLFGTRAPVYCLDLDIYSDSLAAGVGVEVHISKKILTRNYATFALMPKPPGITDSLDTRIRPRSVHFEKNGTNLIVAYLSHGIICWDIATSACIWRIVPAHAHHYIGFSSLLRARRLILISNLSSGMDLYRLGSSERLASFRYMPDASRNYPLAVSFLQNGQFVMCGAPRGDVRLWDLATEEPLQVLSHADDLIQTVCAGKTRLTGYIATASAQAGSQSYIKIWHTKLHKNSRTSILWWLGEKMVYYFKADISDICSQWRSNLYTVCMGLAVFSVLVFIWLGYLHSVSAARIYHSFRSFHAVEYLVSKATELCRRLLRELWLDLRTGIRTLILDLLELEVSRAELV